MPKQLDIKTLKQDKTKQKRKTTSRHTAAQARMYSQWIIDLHVKPNRNKTSGRKQEKIYVTLT